MARRRYKTKLHSPVAVGGRWDDPLYRALCAARAAELASDEAAVTCEVCLRYLARRRSDALRWCAEVPLRRAS